MAFSHKKFMGSDLKFVFQKENELWVTRTFQAYIFVDLQKKKNIAIIYNLLFNFHLFNQFFELKFF
jgi:hypothetical protein